MPKWEAGHQTIKFEFSPLANNVAFVAEMRKPAARTAVLVGCGGISRTWLNAFDAMPEVRVVGLVDVVAEAPARLAAERGWSKLPQSTDLDAMLGSLKPDLLFVCSIPEAHEGNILTGLQHGCHVLTEKPLASTMAEARAIVQAARKARRFVAVTQNYRYGRAIRSVKRFIDSGRIGRVVGLDVDFYIGAHFEGFRAVMEHVLLVDMCIHPFDMARYLAGGTPVSVLAHEWNPPHAWMRHGGSTTTIFKFANGVVFNFRGSWCSQGFDTGWDGTWRILGEKGSVLWNGDDIRAEIVVGKTGFIRKKKALRVPLLPEGRQKVPPVSRNHFMLFRDFIACLEKGVRPPTAVEDNIQSLAMVHAAIASAEQERWMPIAE